MSDFDDDFDNFEENDFNDFNQKSSLKTVWQNNPLLKIFVIISGIILVIAAIFIFGGATEDEASRIAGGVNERETLGGELSPTYTDAIEDVNRQRLEQAVQTGDSTIPMLVNPEEQELLTPDDGMPPFQDFDPLKTFRNTVQPQAEPAENLPPPVLLDPQQVVPQQQPQAPGASVEAVQALAQAMSTSVEGIFENHIPRTARITQVTAEDFLKPITVNEDGSITQLIDTDGDGIPDTPLSAINGTDATQLDVEEVEIILIPSGTINYAQILVEANSDVPGPVLAQLVSGPLRGARLIGDFTVKGKYLVLQFDSIVIDGINQPVSAIAIDPNTTLPGVASEVNNRYFSRVLLPAAARFLEGVGSAIAEDSQTTVTVSRDTVIQEQSNLDFEQEVGRGVEAGFEEIADFMEKEANGIRRLVRVQRGTPVGIFFTEPVLEATINND